MKPGHKIGKPAPLFAKIEQAQLDELKKKYGGSQAENNAKKSDSKPAAKFSSAKEAEAAIAEQGDKVRALKTAGAEKAVVTEQVNILLALKKQLAALQSAAPSAPETPATNGTVAPNAAKIAEIEAQITKQGERVRECKASSDKSVWQPEVDKLLELKKQLIAAGGSPPAAPQSSGKNKKKK